MIKDIVAVTIHPVFSLPPGPAPVLPPPSWRRLTCSVILSPDYYDYNITMIISLINIIILIIIYLVFNCLLFDSSSIDTIYRGRD